MLYNIVFHLMFAVINSHQSYQHYYSNREYIYLSRLHILSLNFAYKPGNMISLL